MDMREMFTIDGRRFSNMAGFYDEVEQVFICGLDWKIGRNLNAFNDILRGGFGRHEYGQPIHIQWLAYEKSVRILTKSFEEFIGLKNSAYVDINNCPFAPQLLNRGFAKDTGLYKESGFCSYPLWTFDETVLKETGGEKYERYARAYDEYMESSFIGMMGAEDETGEEICTGMMM